MAMYDYAGALRRGRKQYHESVSAGEYPYLPVLDDILANTEIVSEVSLGLTELPLEKIVGTCTKGRTQAFASNFMPLMEESSEFADKWSAVYEHQLEQGIYDPVIVYEFMNRYYVQEGNKRVSVLKYVGAYSISAQVTRLIPRLTQDHDIRMYYEFLDFYQVSFNTDLWFTKEGSYNRLLELLGKKPGEVWKEEERKYFSAVYRMFAKVFASMRTESVPLGASDAFLKYLEIFGYEYTSKQIESEMKKDLTKIWYELAQADDGSKIEHVENPEQEKKKPAPAKILDLLMPGENMDPSALKVAFIYTKSAKTSSWAYAHELGRAYLEKRFPGIQTIVYSDAGSTELVEKALHHAIEKENCNIIFTTGPQMALQSVREAVQHRDVKIFNCSVNISYSSIYTYYARMYESKFLMGALAASMCETDHLGYIADYPIYGMIANINAFAIGASMINPRAKIHLKWTGLKEHHAADELKAEGVTYISGDDMITPINPSREYGLYHVCPDGHIENLATPITDWGRFYEQLILHSCHGTMNDKGKRAVNFWWGMSANVVDFIYSENLSIGTQRLIKYFRHSIRSGAFHPFFGPIYTKDGRTVGEKGRPLNAQEIIRADWLCSNIIGEIPPVEMFEAESQAVIYMQGVLEKKKTQEGN
jgi:basic membrane lipoprotein Med (substrate-binding protein (PBP1-ABC) superfamily)